MRKNIVFATSGALALLGVPAAAQNLLERSVAPPAYEEQAPEGWGAPAESEPSTALPPVPGLSPAPPGANLNLPPGANPGAPGSPGAPGNPAAPGATPGTPAVEGPPPPYEPQLLRLSELLGALTYLQDLCGGQHGQIWRDKMTALMDAETADETRREQLAGAYNLGFRGYELSYRQCTPNAQAIITRFLDESGKIARDVTHRYGTS